MASSSTQTTLQELLAEIIEWIQTSDVQAYFKENEKIKPCSSMPSTISEEKQGVFAQVNWSSSFSAILFLRDHVVPRLGCVHRESISLMCQKFRENDVWIERFRVNPENYKQVVEMLDSFFKELFQLPQLQHDDEDVDDLRPFFEKLSKLRKKQPPDNVTLIKYHLPGDFLKFLEEFLKYETLQVSSFGLDNVLKELKYLIPIFRDRPFLALKHQVQCLWEQFEWLINETGRLVHLFISNPNRMDTKFCDVLTSSIELLKDNIRQFFRTLPNLSSSSMVVYHDVDSFIIIHSLANDLENLVSRQCTGPIFEIKDQIRELHQGLALSWPSVKEHIKVAKFKQLAVQIRDMAYGAEYMINSCLAGETHVWYVKLSLTTVIRDIELIRHWLPKMKEGDRWALNSSSTQTLQELLAEITEWIQRSDAHTLCNKKEKMIPCLWMPSVSEEKQEAIAKVNCPGSFNAIFFLRDHVVPRLGRAHQELFFEMCRRFRQNHVSLRRFRFNLQNYKEVEEVLEFFFKELFQLPKIHHVDVDVTLIEYHLTGDFLKFLEEFLKYETLQLSPFGLDNVLKELDYLIPIFQDRPFLAHKDEVQCLWEEFQRLINETGRLVHIFISNPNLMDRKFCVDITSSIELLKGNIMEFIRTLPNLSTSSMVVNHDVDSFFIIHSLSNDLEDLLSQSDGPIVDIKDQIRGLLQGLKLSWTLLKEHIEVQEFKDIAVQVRDMAYGAEYMINSCLAEKTHAWYVKLSLTSVIHHNELIVHQLLEMKERSDDCAMRSVSNNFADKLSLPNRRSTAEVNAIIVGFQEEEQSILEQLLRGTRNLQKVGIVGTPGLGKTTLAKKLHEHRAIYDRFDRRSWCVVSQRYERKNLLVDILKGMGEEVKPDLDEASLELQIHKTLKGRRYLITLDDIWNLDGWDDVGSCFPDDENGSRIVFTSRNEDAAPCGSIINSLPFLSNDQCWELIRKLVFLGETCPPMLEEIGKKISEKCKGLPLIATVIAGILSIVDKELEAWKNVMHDLKLQDFLDQNEQVLQTLEVSYKHLLQHLKPCFLYFALFREDEKISVKMLKQYWVAEGFIEEDEEKKKHVESIAGEYLMELINKSLVMVVERGSDGKVKTCGMHDLLHSMCIRIAEEEKFLKRVDYSCSSLESLKFNRLLFPFTTDGDFGSWPRSIFIHPRQSNSELRSSFVDNTSLRVLDDQSYRQYVYSFINVVSLRYLAVSGYRLNLNGSFLKLEYLILLSSTVCIPSQIREFRKLRFLKARSVVVDDDCEISQLPNNLEYLSTLQIYHLKCIQLLKSTPYLRRLKFFMVFCYYSLKITPI